MPEKFTSFADSWEDFREKVYSGASEDQIRELRLSYYSGGLALYSAIFDLDPGDEPTEQDLARMDELYNEIKDNLMLYMPTIGETT